MTDASTSWPLLLAGAAGGLLLTLAFPPFGWTPFVLAGPALLIAAIRKSSTLQRAIAAGLVFGAVFMGTLMWWLINLELAALLALIVSQAPFFGVFAAVVYPFRRRTGWSWVVVVAGTWAAVEFIRARFPLGGLEWGGLGYSLGAHGWLRNAAQWLGTSGWAVVVMVVVATIVPWVSWKRAAVAFLPVLLLAAAGALLASGPDGEILRVAIIQGNTPCPEHCPGERAAIFDNHLQLTRQLQPGEFDLVVWAESSSTFDPAIESDQLALIAAEAARLEAFFLVGGDRPDTDSTFVNSNVVLDPEGTVVSEIRKVHPVPFGEYVPLRPVFGRLAITSQVPRDMVRGTAGTLATIQGVEVGSVISFDGSFARYARSAVAAGAQAIVIASNEASYGDSPASDQFIGMTRMRSAELGVDVVHAAITGSSAFITQGGEVGPRTELYEAATVTGEISVRESSATLFGRWGDWVAVLAMAGGAAVAMWESMLAARPLPQESLRTTT